MDEDIARLWWEWGRQIRARPADDPTVVLMIGFPLRMLAIVAVAFHKAWG